MKRDWENLGRDVQSDKTRPDEYAVNILDNESNHNIPSLTLAQYVVSISGVPLPTTQQRENFVDYVAHAHSWYKHLDYNLPGNPFYFFIDKYAGCDRIVMPDGRQAFAERSENGFHYSEVPTEEYRTRFGHLAYSCDSGTTVFLAGQGPIVLPRDGVAAVPTQDARLCGLPEEILEAGLVRLTCVIHTFSASDLPFWEYVRDWPEESGGQAVLEKIVARAQAMAEPTFQLETRDWDNDAMAALQQTNPSSWLQIWSADPVLYELLAPERKRQYGEIMKAIDRVCETIDSQRNRPTHRH